MEKLGLIVRKDWQEHLQRRAAEDTRVWRAGQAVIVFSALALVLLTVLHLPPLWNNALRFAFSWVPFLSFSLWSLFRKERRALLTTGLLTLLFAGLAGFAAYMDPRLQEGVTDILPYWVIVLSLVIPAASWVVILPILRRYPRQARQIGLHLQDWQGNLLIGAMSGAALGVHLLYTTYLLPSDIVSRVSFSRSALFWSFSLLAGLWVPGEEFIFRGLGFHLLNERGGNTFWATTLRLTLLDVLLYLVLALQTPSITLSLLTIVYRTALSIINAFLFFRRKSLLPCMAANLVFTFIMLQLFRL